MTIRSGAYAELWGVVDGAVTDAFKNHPDYLTPKGHKSARTSVVKRVCGTVLGFAEQSARGRLQAAETSHGAGSLDGSSSAVMMSMPGEAFVPSPPNPHCRVGKIVFRRPASSRILTEFNVTTNRLIAEVKAKEAKGDRG